MEEYFVYDSPNLVFQYTFFFVPTTTIGTAVFLSAKKKSLVALCCVRVLLISTQNLLPFSSDSVKDCKNFMSEPYDV